MSRQIKFRAWVKTGDYSEMLHNVQNHIGVATGFGHLLQGTAKGINESHVMQFTGLTDKNGAEIYEGDIVEKTNLSEYAYSSGDYIRGEIVFHGLSFFERYNHGDGAVYYGKIDDCKVVGNIYQNPELLEQSK